MPGENGTEACGSCGERVRTCTDQCLWGAYGPCENEGVCAPGATTFQSCGDCGTQTRTCSASCTWGAYGACGGEGPCAPDETSNQSCGNCGSQTRTCEENCTWGAYGNCGGEGVCTPGATQELSCNECGTQNQVCSAACAWANSGSCDNTPGLPASCDDADMCTTDTCDAAGNCSNTGCGGGTPNCCAGRCRECCSNADCVGGEICCGLPTYACALAQNCPVSDQNMKTGFATVEPEEVLETLASVPVSTWSYIGEEGVRHMGPMAQDFHAAYGLGETDTRIHVLDQGGVAFSSIQALRERTEQLRRENAALRDENERLVEALRTLERRVTNLERHRERPD